MVCFFNCYLLANVLKSLIIKVLSIFLILISLEITLILSNFELDQIDSETARCLSLAIIYTVVLVSFFAYVI